MIKALALGATYTGDHWIYAVMEFPLFFFPFLPNFS